MKQNNSTKNIGSQESLLITKTEYLKPYRVNQIFIINNIIYYNK